MSQRRTSVFVGLSVPLLLFACGRSSSPSEADPYAGGQSYPWQEVNLTPQALTPGTNTLQYETPTLARNSWGPVERNTSNGEQKAGDGKPLTLNGKVYAQGYGVHAGSELKFNLQGTNGAQCSNFTAQVGVDDEVGTRGSVVFQVFADGVKLYDSGVMTGASATKRVNVGVVGRQELRLVVTDAGNGISSDHADWADPRLECATQKPKAGSLDTSWGEMPGFPEMPSLVTRLDDRAGPAPDNAVLLGNTDRNVLLDGLSVTQPDGRRLVVTNLDGGGFELRRLLWDGGLDSTFSQGGRVTTGFGIRSGTARDAILQPDGKLVVVGGGQGPSSKDLDFALARYNTNGSLDVSFGQGGLVFTDLAPAVARGKTTTEQVTSTESVQQVALGRDGALVVLGEYDSPQEYLPGTYGMARYKTDGSLDLGFAAFHGLGMDTVTASATSATFALSASGDILLSGTRYYAFVDDDVRLIPAAGGPRRSSAPFSLGSESNGAEALAVQADGKIIVLGRTYGGASDVPEKGALLRLNADLTVDRSFGNDGTGQVIFTTQDPTRGDAFDRVLIQLDGKIVAVGDTILRFWP